MKRISILGLGIMGSRMAANLLRAGYELTVWNRSPQRVEALAKEGASVAATPKDAALASEIVISMVSDIEASRNVWLSDNTGAIHGLSEGKLAIESSTLTPQYVRELSDRIANTGSVFLEAPVVGSRPHVEKGELIYLCGGSATALEQNRRVFEINSSKIYYFGSAGNATAMKLAVNALMGIQVAAYSEVLGMLTKAGIQEEKAAELLTSLPVASPVIQRFAPLIAARKFSANFPLRLMEKDLNYAFDTATSVNAPAPTVAAVREIFASAVRQEFGDSDISGISQLYLD